MNRTAFAGILFALCALAACQPQDPNGAPALPPADAPTTGPAVDHEAQITALGTEPFWSVEVDARRLVLSLPGEPELVAPAPVLMTADGETVWRARTADGRMLSVTLRAGACSDGMSDRSYPMRAEAVIGAETLRGCAVPTADLRPE